MSGLRPLLLALVFASELVAWAGIGIGAFGLTGGGVVGALAAVVAVTAALIAWGRWAAPRAHATGRARLTTKILVLGGSVVLLLIAHHPLEALGAGALIVVAHAGARLTAPGGSR